MSLRIHGIVQESPGIHFRALGRAARLRSTGQLRHHLDRLARRGAVCEVADGRYRRYFPAGQAADLQPHLARLSRPVPRRIVRELLAGPLPRTALRRRLGCAGSSLGYHLARLLRMGDLQRVAYGLGSAYALADPERVRRVLRVQEGAPPSPVGPRLLFVPGGAAPIPGAAGATEIVPVLHAPTPSPAPAPGSAPASAAATATAVAAMPAPTATSTPTAGAAGDAAPTGF